MVPVVNMSERSLSGARRSGTFTNRSPGLARRAVQASRARRVSRVVRRAA
ncbi:hypothetical protein C7S16_6840 [Burkholderia thailandensis]|uniref:Uncharacterized protein n=1 Tax=Burkholderia thailandensis TaxID=57975 RepID=A0AAW9CPU2_BURTH|nr:hypothetical protein [Burkholderia thailandensis]MDW9251626.1 hypothetical protein [Burkholderia thailandensis]